MTNPLNFWPNPQQAARIREDQYFPVSQPWAGVGEYGWTYTDSRGNAHQIQPSQQDVFVTVTADDDGNVTDSNGYYKVLKLDPWFKEGATDLKAEMRLDSDEDLEAGDNVHAIFYSTTDGSPDPDDDGMALLKEIIAVPSVPKPFKATLTDRDLGTKTVCGEDVACYVYGWDECESPGGTLAAAIHLDKIQTADGLNPTIYEMHLIGFTAGSYTLTEDGGSPSSDIDYTDDPGGELSEFTVTGSYPDWTLTGVDGSDHTLTADLAKSKPKHPHKPAAFLNCGTPMCVPVDVFLQLSGGTNPNVRIFVTQKANGDDKPMKWKFTRQDLVEGTVSFVVDGGDPIDTPEDATASDIEAALSAVLGVTVTDTGGGEFTIECDEDNETHTITVSCSGCTGTQVYDVIWSNPTNCCIWGGVDLTAFEDFNGPPEVTASITPSGSSVGPWTLSIAGADSGFYDIKVDGGSTVSTAYGSCPTLAGFTVTGSFPDCVITGDGMTSHAFVLYPARLRSHAPKQVPYLDPSTGCMAFEVISSEDC